MKFLEAMRIGDVLLKRETIDLMVQNQLTPEQFVAFRNERPGYTYGLGVRTAAADSGLVDFGWDGAAGAHLSIDRVNNITVFYVQHVLGLPIGAIKVELYERLLEDLGLPGRRKSR